MSQLVIIGNGIAGVTVAREVRKKSSMKILIISAETDYFFSRTALMYIYMGHMKFEHSKPYEDDFWKKNKIDLKRAFIESIDSDRSILKTSDGEEIPYEKLVIATGSKSNKFGWPGQDLPGVQGLYSYQDLELMEENTKSCQHAVIIGGGLIGIEMAEMLLSRGIAVTFLVRESVFWGNILPKEEGLLVRDHGIEHGVNFKFETELKEIVAGTDGRVSKIITNKDEEVHCQFVGLTAGVSPNIDFVKSSTIETGRGILVNDFLETNIENIYACGDCAEIKTEGNQRNRIEPLWYTGKLQAQALAKTILGKKTFYERGIWFNSAKFFDIEYQTYGFVASQLPEDSEDFYWQAETNKHCIRFVYNKKSKILTGVNVFGIRLRHKVFESWIKNKKSIDYVMSHLKDANFDPEFYKKYDYEILAKYNADHGKNLELSKLNWFTKRFI